MLGAFTLQTTLPSRVMRVIHASRISETRMSPFSSGVAPFGEASRAGGSWRQSPGLPHCVAIAFVSGSMMSTRQLRMSAVRNLPSESRCASSG